MVTKVESKDLFLADHGWLKSRFHFSFAEYYNPQNVNFGVLRVLNDDIVQAGTGFGAHPHRDMEIVSYVVDGRLTHRDNMGNERTIGRGHVQYMSAGTGVVHSEYNQGDGPLRFLQLWILPDRAGHEPAYGDFEFQWAERSDRWLHLVSPVSPSSEEGAAPVRIHQDANFYVTETANEIRFEVGKDRQAYLVLVEGAADVNGRRLETRDALTSQGETLVIRPDGKAHVFVVEMARS